MAQSNWEADKMLDVYIHDYLLKRNLQATAKAFKEEGKVATDPVAIDAPGGFLFEWWSVFWDIFIARTNEKHSQVAAAYIETQRAKAKEEHQRQLQMQQLQLIQQQAQLQQRGVNHPPLNGTISSTNTNGISGPPTASLLAAKLYEERMKQPQSMDSEISPQLLDANRVALIKSANNHPGQFIQNNPVSGPAATQHVQGQNQQTSDIKGIMGVAQRSLNMDPSSLYGHGIMQAKSGLSGAGMTQGVSGLPLKGWPLAGIDQLRQNFGPQVNKPFLSNQSQFQLLSPNQQQQFLAQAQAQSNIDLSNCGIDPRRLRALPRSVLSGKDGQMNGNDASIGSPSQSSSPKVTQDQAFLKATQMQQSSNQQTQELVQQQQMQQNTRKRKTTSSGPANSTGTGNTAAPSANSPPSTPSIHTPGDGVSMAGNLQNANTMSKSLMMYGTDKSGRLASSSHLDDLEHFGDVGSLDDNVESFLSNDDGDGQDIFAALKSTAENNVEPLNGFSFNDVSSMQAGSNKVVCCNFSTDGKLLASAGHDKKVVVWNMESLQTVSSSPEHSHIITDVCFRPNSTQLATSSFDKTVRLWSASESIHCLRSFTGHSSQITSLDFHPKETDIFCSCDDNGEIRYWNASQYSCTQSFKGGGTVQVRFQPRSGQFLAAAADNMISIFDVETHTNMRTLQGHKTAIQSICWDLNGSTLASVSQDLVKIWSTRTWDCISELSSNGNQFHSCIFHPRYTQILVIGGYQSLELWNRIENQTMTVQAHEGVIAALAQSSFTGMIASASHDKSVKLWK
ncbi:transcriptional corepressor LEUNIG_HOMOLOG-like isoform X1 [Zingiber officinale]|uniref:transcriptional corepressor LEUNIG_HOMOLOG-like isoform X1 n=2 Tax=Zingiber officinale TaxID=94328 RepID=UPI001C4CE284|nr:transcriptional corepressor LEUNIG_HOMOLOG-like isoform X1 [Zingiber officinale]XP_042376841.1 transcriptional corepressor LEUNIG_HOMOLOG-like isoform X1 [Zingiber officinale]XP_042376849.1 transcriptional corepressor LEUNIG_HOMOLOG-like isoform X1 [Zingiber officinale]